MLPFLFFVNGTPLLPSEKYVDLELILSVDVSASMDKWEKHIQRQGYVDAIRSPEVIKAIESGPLGRIAVMYLEWAGPGEQFVVLSWTIIHDAESAENFAGGLAEAPALEGVKRTSITDMLNIVDVFFDISEYEGMRQVIDVSGDGPNAYGGPVVEARDRLVGQGRIINGLPIMIRPTKLRNVAFKELDIYYEDCVIGGPGAFIVPVTKIEQFEPAIRRKLVLEIGQRGLPPSFAGMLPIVERIMYPRVDCLLGENNRATVRQ